MSPMMLLRAVGLFLVFFASCSLRLAAQDDTSVADAARRARQQKQEAAKPAHVMDNDSIPPSPAASSATPQAANPPTSDSRATTPAEPAAASDSSDAKKSEANSAEDEAQKKEIETLKKEIAEKKEKLDLQKREMALDQDTYISNPDHVHDVAGKQKLDSMQDDITQAQSELTELQAKLAALAPPADPNAPGTQAPQPQKP
jgi:uncharacterized coiled-coil protein SlyX